MQLNLEQLRDLALYSMKHGTERAFIDVALAWALGCVEEVGRLRDRLDNLETFDIVKWLDKNPEKVAIDANSNTYQLNSVIYVEDGDNLLLTASRVRE